MVWTEQPSIAISWLLDCFLDSENHACDWPWDCLILCSEIKCGFIPLIATLLGPTLKSDSIYIFLFQQILPSVIISLHWQIISLNFSLSAQFISYIETIHFCSV